MKTVFRKSGRYDWKARLPASASRTRCTRRSSCASSGATSCRSPPDHATQAALEALYRDGYHVQPVLQAILQHPALYNGPRMVKPPVVHVAGLLRRIGAAITTTDWSWIGSLSGQQLFYPPNVAGWDDTRWLDTATYRGRWIAVQRILQDRKLEPGEARTAAADAPTVLEEARSRSGTTRRSRTRRTRRCCTSRALRSPTPAGSTGSRCSTRCSSRTRCAS